MHDESNQKAAVRSNMPPKPHQSNQKKASPEASPQQTHSLHQEHTTNNVVGNTSFVEPFSLPPSSTSFATAPTGHSQHLVSNFSLTSNTVGSLSNRGGGGTSPIPPASHITSPPLAFSDPPAVGANIPSLIFQPVPIRRSMERAFVVKWAAENHPNRAHQVQLYQYAAQVAADFEPTSPSASSKATEVGAFRDVCLHRAKLLFQALNPVDRHAPPRGVCAFAAARLWMHTIHDARVASITPWVEMEAIYRAAALMCDIVSEDPTTEVSVRNQAGTMRELIQARWQRIADGVSPAVLYPY
ncbi:Hypothetical protein, putative [Bodo saltans]|uniref:Uncharacterized protein n=1 Tax=Bodo saltans TaxID=75058 RepID=A0A0S4JC10_BODSA|nr:Hypothetical protein, putative [Bodo saltans]|eukprot:CUG86997.1 Hypothetical protein, putative [Bodo saltans]